MRAAAAARYRSSMWYRRAMSPDSRRLLLAIPLLAAVPVAVWVLRAPSPSAPVVPKGRDEPPVPVAGPLASHGSGVYSDAVMMRHVDDGFPTIAVYDLEVDPDGWLWMATVGGLYRHESPPRRWGGDLNDTVDAIVDVRDGVALVALSYGRLARMYRDHTEMLPVPGPTDTVRAPLRATVDDRGRVWAVYDRRLYRLDGTTWTAIDVGAPVRRPDWVEGHGLWVVGEHALIALDGDGVPIRTVPVDNARRLIPASDGTIYVTTGPGNVMRLRGHDVETVYLQPPDAMTGFALRGDDPWFADSRHIRRLRDGALRELGAEQGVPMGGTLAVDHEGDVWYGGYLGLFELPAPEARLWTDRDGLPDRTPRTVTVDEAGNRWVVHWQGPAVLDAAGAVTRLPIAVIDGEICSDARGGLWAPASHTWEDPVASVVKLGLPPTWYGTLPGGASDCATDPEGGIWIAGYAGLAHVDPAGTIEVLDERSLWRVHQAGDTLWTEGEDRFCHAPVADVKARTPTWACDPVPGAAVVIDMIDVDGEIWATAHGFGVVRWDGRTWSPLAMAALESSTRLEWLSRSPRGGVWVAGHGVALRAEPDGAGGWRILERLNRADGLPVVAAGKVFEEPGGRLHVTTPAGLVEIPASERGPRRALPIPEPVEARFDGGAIDPGARIDAVGGEHELEVRYAVPAYRDPESIRWRVRTGPDRPWSEPTEDPRFRWVGLPLGTSRIEVQVGRDGGDAWTSAVTGPTIVLLRPWYQRWWALTIWATLAAVAAYALHRVRLAILLRVEQERTRIAMDLHDEIGSGLGSISLLAGMAADDGIADPARRGIAADAARIAQDLGSALGDIVWSLRRDGGSPESLASHVADRGSRMFDPERTAFSVETPPSWPDVELSLPVRREVRRMVVEALNNAAKHANARHVTLRIRPGRRWTIEVEDDGQGLRGESSRPGTGLGMDGMRARAERIGASVAWRDRPEGGTIVEIVFDPHGRGRWPWQPGWW